MLTKTHTHRHTHIHTRVHTHIHADTHTHTHSHRCVHAHTEARMHTIHAIIVSYVIIKILISTTITLKSNELPVCTFSLTQIIMQSHMLICNDRESDTDRQTDTHTYRQTITIPSVDAAVSIVLPSAAVEDVSDVLPPATGAIGPESVVVAVLVVD